MAESLEQRAEGRGQRVWGREQRAWRKGYRALVGWSELSISINKNSILVFFFVFSFFRAFVIVFSFFSSPPADSGLEI